MNFSYFLDWFLSVDWKGWLTAIGTVGAVIISLFATLKPFSRARFRVGLDQNYSCILSEPYQALAAPDNQGNYYRYAKISLLIEHTGGNAAKNVEVLISKIWKIEDGERVLYKYFFPSNLRWDSADGMTLKNFPKNVKRFCELGVYGFSSDAEMHLFSFSNRKRNDDIYDSFSSSIPKGKYEIEVVVAGDNVKNTQTFLSLEFDGNMAENERDLFSNHIKVTVLR